MKKLIAFFLTAAALMTFILLPVSADTPAHDAGETLVTGNGTLFGLGINGTAKSRDFMYAGNFSLETTSSGQKVVAKKSDDETEAASQAPVFGPAYSSASGCTGAVNTNYDKLYDIGQNEGTPSANYYGAFLCKLNGELETSVGSFTIAMGPDSALWGKKLNGFDIWLGNEPVPNPDGYQLAYHAENLVDYNLWKTSDDGTYCFFEADFDQFYTAAYAVIAFYPEGLATAIESGLPNNPNTMYAFLISELSFFETTLDGKAAEVVTEPETDPVTQAVQTENAETKPEAEADTSADGPDAGGTDAAEPAGTQEGDPAPAPAEKKGCGASVSLLPLAVCALFGCAVRKKNAL